MVFDQETDSIYYDRVHVGDKGNLIVAKELSTHIFPLIQD